LKLLFDQNLSHRLPIRLADLFPQSAHIRLLGMEQASDAAIWNHAKAHGYVIVTLDSDFTERSKLYGAPPKIVWLRCGNTTSQRVEDILRANAALILDLSESDSGDFVEIF
jgi:predicted nuclease of predicted toxin-antitoxin system